MKKYSILFLFIIGFSFEASSQEARMWQTLGEASYQYFHLENYFDEVNDRLLPKDWRKFGGIVWMTKCAVDKRINYEIGW